jgi:hypothetical protein
LSELKQERIGLGFAARFDRRVATVVSYFAVADARIVKALALGVLLAQFILTCLSAAFHSILFADGSFFSFVIAAGDPWGLHWHNFCVRISAYILTVWPVLTADRYLHLSGDGLASLYSMVFNGVSLLQFCIIAAIGWRRFPSLLIFPVVDYTFAVGLGYGFPSEMILVSGFFWICMLLISFDRPPLPLIFLSFVAQLFLHELALPAALLVPFYLFVTSRRRNGSLSHREIIFFALCAAALAVWAYLKFGGFSGGGNSNVVRSLDPRKLLDNPSLWCVLGAASVSAACMKLSGRRSWVLLAIAVSCVEVVCWNIWFKSPSFIDGRYDSARTVMAASVLVLGGVFIALRGFIDPAHGLLVRRFSDRVLGAGLAAALAANFASSAIFLHESAGVRAIFSRYAIAAEHPPDDRYFSISDLSRQDSLSAATLERADFSWTWPYTAIMVSENFKPAQVIFDPASMPYICSLLTSPISPSSTVPVATIESLKTFACAQPRPPDEDTISNRIRRRLFGP